MAHRTPNATVTFGNRQQNFIFCACDGTDGRLDARTKRRARRHVQLLGPSQAPSVFTLPARQQRIFRLSKGSIPASHTSTTRKYASGAKRDDEVTDFKIGVDSPLVQRGQSTDVNGTQVDQLTTSRLDADSQVVCPRCGARDVFIMTDPDFDPDGEDPRIAMILDSFYSGCIHAPHTASAYREGMWNLWSRSMFPAKEQTSHEVQGHVGNWIVPRMKAQAATFDAIILFELAQVAMNDKRVAMAASEMYYYALRGFRVAVKRAISGGDVFSVKVLAQVRLIAEIYQPVSPDFGPRQWEHHIRGLVALEKSSSGQSEDTGTPLGRVMSRALRLECLMAGLILREDLGYDLLLKSMPDKLEDETLWQLEEFASLALQLPILLQGVDSLLNDSKQSSTTASPDVLLQQAATIAKGLHAWYNRYFDLSSSSPYTKDVPRNTLVSPLLPRNTSTMFPIVLNFSTYLTAHYHTIYWICSLLIGKSVVDLLESRKESSRYDHLLHKKSHAQVQFCAEKLCQTVPYMLSYAQDTSSSKALAVAAPLYFAKMVLARSSPIKAEWCDQIQTAIQASSPRLNWDAVIFWHLYAILWYNPAV